MKFKICFWGIYLILLTTLNGCYYAKCFFWRAANLNDYQKFPNKFINKADSTFNFIETGTNKNINLPKELVNEKNNFSFEEFLIKTQTTSLLIIKNDSIIYENYFFNHNKNSLNPSFSVAKSFLSALVGIAISEGYIKGVNEPITNYLTELKNPLFSKITIEDLLNMRSGIKYRNSVFNPFGPEAKLYYGEDLKNCLKHFKIKNLPDEKFYYESFSAELLGIILERAIKMPISVYLQTKIWEPLGMESDALWSMDSKKNQTEKAFCCLNAITRDFAKFGRLYLNDGIWKNKQILTKDWIKLSSSPSNPKQNFYSYMWWLGGDGIFFGRGFLGQYLFINKNSGVIMVRSGRRVTSYELWLSVFKYISTKV